MLCLEMSLQTTTCKLNEAFQSEVLKGRGGVSKRLGVTCGKGVEACRALEMFVLILGDVLFAASEVLCHIVKRNDLVAISAVGGVPVMSCHHVLV